MMITKGQKPKYLYKILSKENWESSQNKSILVLSSNDEVFIHLAKEDQLQKILDKHWNNVSNYVVLKLETNKLNGTLLYETNPGGTTKYYHLYNGKIPHSSIVDVKVVKGIKS